ncbi:hypothetical protein K504DRAFT_294727 [Pleomassaria siparia CBS 279.74]|uniref:Uncharacterized protein n=1 Tax=Pleomassaria siparia CBS 279.74 TaxID=1314801 RepID=A0A6G1K938_9PLEO|nr:hypothetical protein K504DRAFT_294727 [Pleomassaria siparia CBS 279.74]
MPIISLIDHVPESAKAPAQTYEPNLFDECIFALKVTFAGQAPCTFTRENPSNIFADLFWAGSLFLISLVYAGSRLQELDHGATTSIEGATSVRVMDFLATIVEPLPSFISSPSTLTLHLTKVVIVYCAFRFFILHRNWRFNFLLPHISYAVLSLALWWVYSIDPWLALFAACLWCMPTIFACSVLLHELLGENAWKTRGTLEGTYTANDLWHDLEKKLYSPVLSSGFFSPRLTGAGGFFSPPTPKAVGFTMFGEKRVYTLLDEEDSEGEQEAHDDAFAKLLELNAPEGDRRQRVKTPGSTPRLS